LQEVTKTMNKQAETYVTQLIGYAGAARSGFIKAIDAYSKHDGSYEQLMEEANSCFQMAHEAHFNLFQSNPTEENDGLMLLMHAEDQLMCAETFKIIADRINLLMQDK